MSIVANFKSIFVRKTGRFNQIDGLRALALLWAFSFHTILLFAEVIPVDATREIFSRPELTWLLHGHFSIDIFFIISGFLIGDLLIKEVEKTKRLDFGRFYMRRMMRLAPVYYVVIAIIYLFTALIGEQKIHIENAWANFFYINNFVPFLDQFMPWTWSLAVEEQFYLIAPMIIYFIFKNRLNPLRSIITLIIIGFILNIIISMSAHISLFYIVHPAVQVGSTDFNGYYDLMYNKFYTRYAALLMGVLLAYLIRRDWFTKVLSSNIIAISIVIVASSLFYLVFNKIDYAHVSLPKNNVFMATYRYIFAVGAALLIALIFADSFIGKFFKKILSLNFWYPIAQISYVAFLIQPVIIVLVMRGVYHGQVIGIKDIICIWIFSALITTAFSTFFHVFVEKPWMNLRPKQG